MVGPKTCRGGEVIAFTLGRVRRRCERNRRLHVLGCEVLTYEEHAWDVPRVHMVKCVCLALNPRAIQKYPT